ncbi:hypothetical protein RHS01_02206 [Rhizoctonia solani]|uniref:Chromo domain-containing protein n=1 Tax=Rhizoctonia solani TaxID=456999 RepID=A0A8H7IHP2_9AGAM|nr:hypothetical protein RHS01_02206 [Rhizoctonia solani]
MDLEPSPQVMIPESHFEAFSAHMDSSLLDQIKEATQEDPSLDTILLAVSDPKSMPHSVAQKFKDYTIQEGLLLYQGRIVVPDEPEIKQQLLSHFHDSPASGHQGRAQTLELISCHYYWPAMKFQVNCYVESCGICQRSKGHAHNYALNPLTVPAGPWEDISYGYIVKFPKCKGYDSILVVVDRFSKMMHLVPCKETATAEDVPQMFLEHIWKLHGTPKRTIKNQWLEAYLRPFINHRQSDWVDWLPLAEFAHNHARSKATGKLPFEIVYGRSPVISPLLEPTGLPIADDRAKQLAETIQEVQASIKWAQERYKQANTGKPPPEFQPGGKVWLLASNITLQRPNKKLDHKQYGHFPVIERVGSHAYCLALPETMRIHDVFHVSLLSAFKHDTEFDCTFTPPLPVITAEGEEEYEVDKFVDWAAEDRIWEYRVRWRVYAPHEDTWEPAKDLQHCKDKLHDFFANYLDAPAANNAIPANARRVKRGKIVKQLSKSKTACFVTLQALTAKTRPAKLFLHSPLSQHAHLQLHQRPGLQPLPQHQLIHHERPEMRAHLDSSANIIHTLMSASSCNKVRFFKRNVYKHPKWDSSIGLTPGEKKEQIHCMENKYTAGGTSLPPIQVLSGSGTMALSWVCYPTPYSLHTSICKRANPGNAEPHSALPSGPTSLHKQASNASNPFSTPRHSQANRGACTSTFALPPVLQHARHLLGPGYSSPVRETQWSLRAT